MTSNRDIISKGRRQAVSDAEIAELREANASWFLYCQRRLTMTHAEALASMQRRS